MVDINLIGDEQTGEEKTREDEPLDDFTQTSSMDTQELAFEERTETFDTTKTSGFPHRRSYSSLVSTLIIIGVVIILASAIYFFMLGDSEPEQAEVPAFIPESGSVVETLPEDTQTDLQPEQTQDEFGAGQSELLSQPEAEQPVTQPATTTPDVVDTAPIRDIGGPVSGQFLATTGTAVQTVTDVLTAIPANLNTTLLSYAGGRIRLELVGNSSADARSFASTMNQNLGGNVSVISSGPVAANGSSMEKVLLTGALTRRGGGVQSAQGMNSEDVKKWIRTTCRQLGLEVRQLNSERGSFSNGYNRIPMLARIFGDKASLARFMQEITGQRLNVELTKVLLVSPDMRSYSDSQLMLILNLFVYEAS